MKAVIFDVDGTLVDSVDLHAKAWQQAFHHFGHNYSFDQIRGQIGKGGDELMLGFLAREEVDSNGGAIEKYRGELFKKEYLSQIKPFPQVRCLFERLRSDGWKIALGSSAKKEELQAYREIIHVDDLLETTTSSDDATKGKPYPDIFLAAVKLLGHVAPQNCVVVGDSPYDAEAAAKAGIPAVAFLCGGFPKDLLEKAGFLSFYRDPADLFQNYEQSLFYHV